MKTRLKMPQMGTGDVKKETAAIRTYLFQLVQDLEYELANLNEENMNESYKEQRNQEARLPIGSVMLRENDRENAGFSYGRWEKTNQTVTTNSGKLIVYKRKE